MDTYFDGKGIPYNDSLIFSVNSFIYDSITHTIKQEAETFLRIFTVKREFKNSLEILREFYNYAFLATIFASVSEY